MNFRKIFFWAPFFIVVGALFYFYKPLIEGKMPIPSDTIIGLYHPYRDFFSEEFPRGLPFKNFLITDPVRQIYIWKELSIENLSSRTIPLWNPYEMGGKPLAGNFQSSPFYPLNLILFLKPFAWSWTIFIVLQSILGVIFMFLYLKNLKLTNISSWFGSTAFVLSGYSIAWLEWGNIIHTAIWLPLILLSIDKLFSLNKRKTTSTFTKRSFFWLILLTLSLKFSFLAGHLQTFFYILVFFSVYVAFRFASIRNYKVLTGIIASLGVFVVLCSIQIYQTLVFIINSSRNSDRVFTEVDGWFLPLENLIQFLIPDFFGNPATGNYFGVWNYSEFIGYVGVAPLICATVAIIYIRRKIVLILTGSIILSTILMVQNPISELPFVLNIPFLSSAQPTRIIFIVVFGLSVLSAFGLDYIKKTKSKKIFYVLLAIFLAYLLIGISTFANVFNLSIENQNIALRNMIFPIIIFSASSAILITAQLFKGSSRILLLILIILTCFDLLRFGHKFLPFTDERFLFPKTRIIEFLEKESRKEIFRIATLNDEIMPPNFSTFYRVQSVSGYDPLYLKNYGELIAAVERGEPNINPPFGFNRIINPKNYKQDLFPLLNAKYILTFGVINDPRYRLVMEEGLTKVYEDTKVLPRAFFVERVDSVNDSQSHIETIFDSNTRRHATIFSDKNIHRNLSVGEAIINQYKDNYIEVETNNRNDGFLVLTDVFYPLWEATIDSKITTIYRTNFSFRGVFVPKGKHKIQFSIKMF